MDNGRIVILGAPNLGSFLSKRIKAMVESRGITVIEAKDLKSKLDQSKEFALVCRRHDTLPDLSDALSDKPEPLWVQMQRNKPFNRRGRK